MTNFDRLLDHPEFLFASLDDFLSKWEAKLQKDKTLLSFHQPAADPDGIEDLDLPWEVDQFFQLKRKYPRFNLGKAYNITWPQQIDANTTSFGGSQDYRVRKNSDGKRQFLLFSEGLYPEQGDIDEESEMDCTLHEFFAYVTLQSLLTHRVPNQSESFMQQFSEQPLKILGSTEKDSASYLFRDGILVHRCDGLPYMNFGFCDLSAWNEIKHLAESSGHQFSII